MRVSIASQIPVAIRNQGAPNPMQLANPDAANSRPRALGGILRVLPLFAVAGLIAVIGAGLFGRGLSSPADAASPINRVYVANNGANDVSSYSVDSGTGLLVPAAGVVSGNAPIEVTTVSSGGMTYVYDTDFKDNTVHAYSIDLTSGIVTPLAPATGSPNPATVGTNPIGVASAASGKFLYVANLGSKSISEFTIGNTTGQLTPTVETSMGTAAAPEELTAVSVGGANFLYVSEQSPDQVEVFTINSSTGALTHLESDPAGNAPAGIVANSTGEFLYVADTGASSDIFE